MLQQWESQAVDDIEMGHEAVFNFSFSDASFSSYIIFTLSH